MNWIKNIRLVTTWDDVGKCERQIEGKYVNVWILNLNAGSYFPLLFEINQLVEENPNYLFPEKFEVRSNVRFIALVNTFTDAENLVKQEITKVQQQITQLQENICKNLTKNN